MRAAAIALALIGVACVGLCPDAIAQSSKLRSVNMLPPPMVPAGSTTIINLGNATLNISYSTDGQQSKALRIASNQRLDIPSPSDVGVSVSFHDGAEIQKMTLNKGVAYALYWESATGRWNIKPFLEAARLLMQ